MKMKIKTRIRSIWLIVISLLLLTAFARAAEEYEKNEILVKFKAETKKEDAKAANNLRWKLDALEIKKFVIIKTATR